MRRSDSLNKPDKYFKVGESTGNLTVFSRSTKTSRSPSGTSAGKEERPGKKFKVGDKGEEDEVLRMQDDSTSEKDKRQDIEKNGKNEEKVDKGGEEIGVMGMLQEILKEIRGNKEEMELKFNNLELRMNEAHKQQKEDKEEMEIWKKELEERMEKRFQAVESVLEVNKDQLAAREKVNIEGGQKEGALGQVNHGEKKEDDERRLKADELQELKEVLEGVIEKNEDLENRSRSANVVFSGVEDCERESLVEVKKKIEDILREKLGLDGIEFVRLHRVGRFNKGRNRIIIGKLVDEREKGKIFLSRKKLKGSSIYIDEDFGAKTRIARMKLRKFGNELKRKGEGQYFLAVDILKIGGRQYKYDERQDEVIEVGDFFRRRKDRY